MTTYSQTDTITRNCILGVGSKTIPLVLWLLILLFHCTAQIPPPQHPIHPRWNTSNHHLSHTVEVRGRKQQFRFRRLSPARSVVKSPVLLLLLLSPTPNSLKMSSGPIIRSSGLCSAPSAPWNFRQDRVERCSPPPPSSHPILTFQTLLRVFNFFCT